METVYTTFKIKYGTEPTSTLKHCCKRALIES